MPPRTASKDADDAATRALGSAARLLRAALARLDDVLMPQTCAVCGVWMDSRRPFLCVACEGAVRAALDVSYCRRCARSAHPYSLSEDDCPQCRGERHWNVAGTVRIGPYVPELRELVLSLKYGGSDRSAEALAELLAGRLRAAAWLDEVDFLTPVPMHWRRRWFGRRPHATLLATALGRRLGLPVARAVRRRRHTPSQLTIASATGRFDNIRGCFDVPRPGRVAGRCVCIIDNLAVTGATLHEVSKALRKAGARRIYAAVAARSVRWNDFQAQPDAFAGPARDPTDSKATTVAGAGSA